MRNVGIRHPRSWIQGKPTQSQRFKPNSRLRLRKFVANSPFNRCSSSSFYPTQFLDTPNIFKFYKAYQARDAKIDKIVGRIGGVALAFGIISWTIPWIIHAIVIQKYPLMRYDLILLPLIFTVFVGWIGNVISEKILDFVVEGKKIPRRYVPFLVNFFRCAVRIKEISLEQFRNAISDRKREKFDLGSEVLEEGIRIIDEIDRGEEIHPRDINYFRVQLRKFRRLINKYINRSSETKSRFRREL